jgi:hypothetical protein
MKNWKAYKAKKGGWKLFDLYKDIEENEDLAKEKPEILEQLVALAVSSHQPIKPGKIYRRDLIEKDRKQAPYGRNQKRK